MVAFTTRIFDIMFPDPDRAARAGTAGIPQDSLQWIRLPLLGLIAFLALLMFAVLATLLGVTHSAPTAPKGWADRDYDAVQGARQSLTDAMAAQTPPIDPTTKPMLACSVATASFGGIFTEDIGGLRPWIGTVSPDAARLQVEAGARAMVLDIWPDPANPGIPVVAAMTDTTQWSSQSWWRDRGLSAGQGRYSNWRRLTRNTAPASDILKAALTAAFNGPSSQQNADPFFLVLRLHGAMTTDYLNYLGGVVLSAIGQNRMPAEFNSNNRAAALCTEPINSFLGRCFVIVAPDIQPGYNSLPNINSYAAFTTAFLATRMGEATNLLETAPNTVMFDPANASAVAAASESPCSGSGPQVPPAAKRFCVIQPTTGGTSTRNGSLYAATGFTDCVKTGAQFVAVNLFSPDSGDGVLESFFNPAYFGKSSFRFSA
jgi:hypothetical protein